jgi:hypothetical protein
MHLEGITSRRQEMGGESFCGSESAAFQSGYLFCVSSTDGRDATVGCETGFSLKHSRVLN